jgi:hypothetical protein
MLSADGVDISEEAPTIEGHRYAVRDGLAVTNPEGIDDRRAQSARPAICYPTSAPLSAELRSDLRTR